MTHIAVIDIGKTNAKLALVDPDTLMELAVVTRPNKVLPGPPWPHFDVDGHWEFLLRALGRFHRDHGIDAISITTHGACVALLASDGSLAAPILDYEHDGPDELAAEYDAIRPPFSETGSPRLVTGLNIGAQLFWQFNRDPDLRDETHQIVTYPQYWAHRLTGITATDLTSLGCHTDLWNPHMGQASSLVDTLGIARKLAPPRVPSDILGPILPEIADQTGLPENTPVYCGIHDSNASLLSHLQGQKAPFGVVSTGTWVIAMSIGGTPVTLDQGRDTLINVNAFGAPVPSARFMGGREYDLLTQGSEVEPDANAIRRVLNGAVMLMPSVMPDTGPFQGHTAHWIGEEPATGSGTRAAAVGFYLALVTAECLDLIGQAGPVLVEGPFARNNCYLDMLATATNRPVHAMPSSTGTSEGAALLTRLETCTTAKQLDRQNARQPSEKLAAYANAWRMEAAKRKPGR